jgi:hypothetical protein
MANTSTSGAKKHIFFVSFFSQLVRPPLSIFPFSDFSLSLCERLVLTLSSLWSSFQVVKTLEQIIQLNGSFSLYMAHGGTNFGFTSGANGGGTSFQPHITR